MACIYYFRQADGSELRVEGDDAAAKYIKENNLYRDSHKLGSPQNTTEHLAAVLRQMKFGENNFNPTQLREYQEKLLDEFIRLEDQANFFFKLGPIVALTKGLGKSFDNIDGVKQNLKDLGIGEQELPKGVPFDIRYAITGDETYKTNDNQYHHKITSNNIRIANEIDALSRTMFMERTPIYKTTLSRTVANMKDGFFSDKIKDMQDELTAFSQIAAYKQWLLINEKQSQTLRNSLIYDSLNPNDRTIVDIAKEAMNIAPDNAFLQFILPVSTTVRVGTREQKRNIARDLINTIQGRTRGRIEPEMIANLMDSFTELYSNPHTKMHAQALFDYLIVKDGLMFKNNSFIKMLPTLMFNDISKATEFGTRLMSANTEEELRRISNDLRVVPVVAASGVAKPFFSPEETAGIREAFGSHNVENIRNVLFKKVFGNTPIELYDKFERVYATDVRHQLDLQQVRPYTKDPHTNQRVAVNNITFSKVGDNDMMHVNLFSPNLRGLSGDAYKERFGSNIKMLEAAGFNVAEKTAAQQMGINEDNIYLNFKKFVRVQTKAASTDMVGNSVPAVYKTYQLVSISRDNQSFGGPEMTDPSEALPRGTFAIYKPVNTVGTSNSTGVADLGPRPTKEEAQAIINQKLNRRRGGEDNAANAVNPSDAPTPGTGGGVLSNESGTSLSRRNDESIQQHLFLGTEDAPSGIVKNHAMSYTMLANQNIWGRNTSTVAEAEAGNRTATTRSFPLGKVGDIITFEGRPQKYVITSVEQLTKEKVQDRNWVADWSRKEGWTVEHFNKVLGGKTVHIGSWQTSFQKISDTGFGKTSDAPQGGTVQGGMFGGLQQLEHDPTQDFNILPDISDEDLNNIPCD